MIPLLSIQEGSKRSCISLNRVATVRAIRHTVVPILEPLEVAHIANSTQFIFSSSDQMFVACILQIPALDGHTTLALGCMILTTRAHWGLTPVN